VDVDTVFVSSCLRSLSPSLVCRPSVPASLRASRCPASFVRVVSSPPSPAHSSCRSSPSVIHCSSVFVSSCLRSLSPSLVRRQSVPTSLRASRCSASYVRVLSSSRCPPAPCAILLLSTNCRALLPLTVDLP
jgi:hypothetical protein